jgi:hypothetical protein
MTTPQRKPANCSRQAYLFKRIQERMPANLLLVDTISSVLSISTDSAYRRLRGETALTFDEADLLSHHFGIPLQDGADRSHDTVVFNRLSVKALPNGFKDYLSLSLAFFEELSRAKDKMGIYAAKDIPVFYYFLFPDLARFKILFWLKTVNQVQLAAHASFAIEHVPEEFITQGLAIAHAYLRTPFTEIWNDETANSTLRQIEYYHEAGLFVNQATAGQLLGQLEDLIRHIQQQATQGVKLYQGARYASYELYHNEILLLDNTIFTKADGVNRVLFSYNAIDYLRTSDTKFCREVQEWFKLQTEKSTLLSRVSEKERNRFFNKICSRIQELRRKLL